MTEAEYEQLLGPEASSAARYEGRTAPPIPARMIDELRILVAATIRP